MLSLISPSRTVICRKAYADLDLLLNFIIAVIFMKKIIISFLPNFHFGGVLFLKFIYIILLLLFKNFSPFNIQRSNLSLVIISLELNSYFRYFIFTEWNIFLLQISSVIFMGLQFRESIGFFAQQTNSTKLFSNSLISSFCN